MNTIASNIFMELYADGYSSSLLYEIVDHKNKNGQQIPDYQDWDQTNASYDSRLEMPGLMGQWLMLMDQYKDVKGVESCPGHRVCNS